MARLLITFLALATTGCSGLERVHHGQHQAGHLRAPKSADAAPTAMAQAKPQAQAVSLGAAASTAAAAKSRFQKAMLTGKKLSGLKALGDKCSCNFHDVCDCDATLKFMQCISDACASSRCDCQKEQYEESCLNIALTCPSLEYECDITKAVCRESTDETHIEDLPTDVVRGDLEHALGKRCKYLEAEKKGWVNADNQLRDLEPLIKKYQDTLTERGEKVPTKTCKHEPPKPKPAKPQPLEYVDPEPIMKGSGGSTGSGAVRRDGVVLGVTAAVLTTLVASF